jgi:hypothetical protein
MSCTWGSSLVLSSLGELWEVRRTFGGVQREWIHAHSDVPAASEGENVALNTAAMVLSWVFCARRKAS